MQRQDNIKHIVILTLPYSTLLNTVGPLEVFTRAIFKFSELGYKPDFSYQTHVVSADDETHVVASSGLTIITEGSYETINYPIDTLILSGLSSLPDYVIDPRVMLWISEQSKVVRRICSVCAGAFLLAEAGVLTGKRATTHWERCDKLAQEYPLVCVEVAPLFVKDGNVYTSAGISSGMDLAMVLVEEDLGKAFALRIAKQMVLFLKRPGNQVQYSNLLEYQNIRHASVRKVCEWIFNNLKEDLTVERLAECVAMSPRNFARVFARELNITPAKYIDRLRVDSACQYLLDSRLSLDEIAQQCGVRSADNLRRLFIKVLDTTPTQYRKSFASAV